MLIGEAVAQGVAIVAMAPATIAQGIGIVVKSDDIVGFSRGIRRIIFDMLLRNEMVPACRSARAGLPCWDRRAG